MFLGIRAQKPRSSGSLPDLLSFMWQCLQHREGLSLWQMDLEGVIIAPSRRCLSFYVRGDCSFWMCKDKLKLERSSGDLLRK